jgi:hypothetical protein
MPTGLYLKQMYLFPHFPYAAEVKSLHIYLKIRTFPSSILIAECKDQLALFFKGSLSEI